MKSGIRTLRSYLKLAHDYEPYILPNTKVSAAKDHGESYVQLRLSWSATFYKTLYGRHMRVITINNHFNPNYKDWAFYLVVAQRRGGGGGGGQCVVHPLRKIRIKLSMV